MNAADAPARPEQEPGDPCGHEGLKFEVEVMAIEDRPGLRMIDLRIVCDLCGVSFKFLGLPAGSSFTEPRVSITSRVLIAPIVPDPDPPTLQENATFCLARRDS